MGNVGGAGVWSLEDDDDDDVGYAEINAYFAQNKIKTCPERFFFRFISFCPF